MRLVVGLGNPGEKYKNTRHNIGFEVIDKLAHEHSINVSKEKFRAHIGEGIIVDKKVILVKPQTYMNLSGESVSLVLNYYNLTSKDIIVVYDDVDLALGKIRIKSKGSSGGQNGVKNIISTLKTEEFLRIKVGIGKNLSGYTLADYVLSRFTCDEIDDMMIGVTDACEALKCVLQDGVFKAMNKFN